MKVELKELHHEAVPGYRKIFIIVFVVFIVYLALILVNTL